MRDLDSNVISGSEMNQIVKVAYRPEKNKDCLLIWQNISGVEFERTYYYNTYDEAKQDYNDIKTMFESLSIEKELLNEAR